MTKASNGTAHAEPEEPEKRVARSLEMLIGEIKKDLAAAERAGLEYYIAAGEKLIEAKTQLAHGKFTKWVTANFEIGQRQATNYMALAAQNHNGIKIPLSDINNPRRARPKPAAIDADPDVVKRAEQNEQVLRRQMALELIDAGYKFIAKKLHPDKGGANPDMARLNAVRDWVRSLAKREKPR